MKRILLIVVSFLMIQTIHSQTTLNEGFETWLPSGWQTKELGIGTRGWRDTFDTTTHTGTGSAHSNIDNDALDNWLISPPLNVVNDIYQLKYWEISKDIGYHNRTTVLVSAGSDDPTSGDFSILYKADALNIDVWEERTIDLSAYVGQTIYVAFRYEGTYHKWYIDDVSVSPSSFVDGALTEIVNPKGVSENPVIAPVNVRIKNLGTTIINDFNINWEVNNVAQTPYSQTGLNLLPGQSTSVAIGTFNFASQGAYTIQSELILLNDFDDSNNQVQGNYEVSSFKDGAIIGITPEGMVPVTGNLDVKAIVSNLGNNTIDDVEILWAVDGVNQTPFLATGLNMAPGVTKTLSIGQYVFTSGLYNISATLNILGEIDDTNNQYESSLAVDTFHESFEGNVFPPAGWSINFGIKDGVNFDTPFDGSYYYVSSSDNNYFGIVTDTIYTPLLDIKNGDRFRFYIKTSPPTPQNISLVWKNGATGEVNSIQTISNNSGMNNWELRDLDISAAAGTNYIGIVATSSGFGETKYDLFTSDAKVHVFNQDLEILNGDMYFLAKEDVSESFECKIKNKGNLSVSGSNYTVKLMEAPDVELASVNGVNLNSWEETTVSINHTFTDISEKRLFFKIAYSADEDQSNNTFREANVSVVPNTVEISAIGTPDLRSYFPFTPNGNTDSLGEDDVSQMLYYNNEFNSPGYVHGIAYKYDNFLEADKVVHYPLKVWISQTTETNLDGGWLPNEQLILVFDGIVEILPGNNRDLYIPFDEPILINGIENVVVKCYQYDPEWPPSIFRFLTNNLGSGPTRTIWLQDVYDLDPENLPTYFGSGPNISFSRFVIDPSTSTSLLSGVVYNNETNLPLANATISLPGSSISVQTDANGNYSFPALPYGNYQLNTSLDGYLDDSIDVVLNTASKTQDIYLYPRIELEVTGTVFGSDNIALPLELVDISIFKDGVLFESVNTNVDGEFIFPLVFGGFDYTVNVFMYGYYNKTINISATTMNIDLGDIVLDQEFISAFDVTVETETEPTVNWKSPKQSAQVKLQKDLNNNSFSYTNSPNENVWLGNFFVITGMTTLTSVEIKTDVYELATDYVTIDIFDLASGEVLATSEPFLIYKDSLMTVDIPNIVVNKTITAMVHWENNPATTNALVVDWSDPNISNSAMIKYPDTNPMLMSVFLGSGAPKQSFILRVNTLDDGNPITSTETVSYNVYRGLASDFPNASKWEKLNKLPVSDLSFIDLKTSIINPNEYYRYAIETVYADGLAEVTYSNSIGGDNLLEVADYLSLSSEIHVYPVPTSDRINIKLGSSIQLSKPIKVFNIIGKEILNIAPSEIQNGYISKSVNALQSGIYLLRFEIDNVIINKKFVVK